MKKLLPFLFFFPALSFAQNILMPEDALRIGLLNNYNIIVAKNAMEADSILNNAGEAGMLPAVALNGGYTVNQNSIHQQYANGNEFTSSNAGTNSMNATVMLSWTLFDGTKMFVVKKELDAQALLGGIQYRSEVLQSSGDILTAYYDVLRYHQKLNAADEILKANSERLQITEVRNTSGIGAKTEVNQAKIDLNVINEERFSISESLDESKRKLNELLARDVNTAFDVPDSLPEPTAPDLKQLQDKMNSSNPDLLALKTQVTISQLTVRESRTQYGPKLTAQTGYNFLHTENTAGFSLYNQSYGWQAGLVLSVPLYNAGKTKRQVQISQLELVSSQSKLAQATLNADLQLQNAYSLYISKAEMIKLEKENVTLARENMRLALDRFRLGEGSALEVQQAQITLSSCLSRLSDLQYELSSANVDLHILAADL